MKLVNSVGNVIKDVGSNKAKAEYLKSLGYKELEKAPKVSKTSKESNK